MTSPLRWTYQPPSSVSVSRKILSIAYYAPSLMMRRLFIQIIIGIAAVWLADKFIEKIYLAPGIENLLIVGAVLGLVNFFIKPALNMITFPLRLLTLGFFGILINMLLVLLVDIAMLDRFDIIGIIPLFWITLLVWGLNIIIPLSMVVAPKRRQTMKF